MSDSKVREFVAAVEARASVDTTGWTAAERSADLLELFALQRALEAAIVEKVREIARGADTP
jgi:hypothetical protein